MMNTPKKLSIILLMLLAGTIAMPFVSYAAGLTDSFNEVDKLQTDAGVKDYGGSLPAFILAILKIVVTVVAVIAVAAIIYAGILLLLDQGSEENVAKAKHIIMYAVIGLILIGLSAVIVNVIINEVVIG